MTEPKIDTITVSELFKQYKKYVSENMDTNGRDIDYDAGIRYEGIEVSFGFDEDEKKAWSCFEHAVLELSVEEEDKQEELNRTIRLSRYEEDKKEGWDIIPEVNPTIKSLKYLNDFDVFVIKLYRANVKLIVDKESDLDTVYSVYEPEMTYE